MKIHRNPAYSCKVFLGGVPWDITEGMKQLSLVHLTGEVVCLHAALQVWAVDRGIMHCVVTIRYDTVDLRALKS